MYVALIALILLILLMLELSSIVKALLPDLAPEVLLAKSEPIVESLKAIGSDTGPKGCRVGGGSQPVGRGGRPEGVGRLEPRVEKVEPGKSVVVPILDCLRSLSLPGTNHLHYR